MLAHFVIRLVCGMLLMLLVMPRRGVPGAFFRILMLVVLGLGALYLAAVQESRWLTGGLCTVAYVSSVLWLLERRLPATVCLGILTAGAAGQLVLSTQRSLPPAAGISAGWFLAGEFASAATLGATMVGMLLGHRYLTVPGMSLTPLQRLNHFVGGAGVLRLAVSAAVLAMHHEGILGLNYYPIWLGLRWLAGIAGPLVVWGMVAQILRYRNTQSATGVLFVGVILTFIGELTADLLRQELHLPL